MSERKTKKHTITANKRVSLDDTTNHEDGDIIGTIEVPDGVDPLRVAKGLGLGHLIIGTKPKPRKAPVTTDQRAKQAQE